MAKHNNKARTSPEVPPGESSLPGATVFVSHDSRDAELADAFENLLTAASGGIVNCFRSSDKKGTAGIDYGKEWFSAILTNLERATDVVALLTTYSIDRPWILFETGFAKAHADKAVFGVVLGFPLEDANASIGPMALLQNCGDDEDSLTKLVLQLIRRNAFANPSEDAVRGHVQAFRKRVSGLMKLRPRISNVLFPFVFNTAGYDTVLMIANTTSDIFGTSSESGSCVYNFFGTNAPVGGTFTTASVSGGAVDTRLLSRMAPGFVGYVIVQCNFRYAHGTACIQNGFGGGAITVSRTIEGRIIPPPVAPSKRAF